MKKNNFIAGASGALIIVLGIAFVMVAILALMYNGLVAADVQAEQTWGDVQAAYQRRADLIPNLVDTVRGARDFEQETLTEITRLRSQAGQAQTAVGNADDPASLNAAGEEMNSVLSRLLVIVENYPQLQTNQNFLALQDELAGTENRINYERNRYNEAVASYKRKVRSFPTNILAGMFGFPADRWETFTADEGAQDAPDVDFS